MRSLDKARSKDLSHKLRRLSLVRSRIATCKRRERRGRRSLEFLTERPSASVIKGIKLECMQVGGCSFSPLIICFSLAVNGRRNFETYCFTLDGSVNEGQNYISSGTLPAMVNRTVTGQVDWIREPSFIKVPGTLHGLRISSRVCKRNFVAT